MDFMFNISPIIKLIVIFIVVIFLIRKQLSLGAALTIGSILLGLWFRLSPTKIGASILGSVLAQRTITLCAVVALILVLSHSMKRTGQLERILISFRGVSRNIRTNLAIFPALIGLLPMPGGAIFSAPMVGEISNQEALTPEQKTLINYWFRHIWEFFWPLYPGVILTCALSGIDIWHFMLLQSPLTVVATCIGYITQLRSIPVHKLVSGSDSKRPVRDFLTELNPILLVIVGVAFLSVLLRIFADIWPVLNSARKEIPLIVALIISIGWVWWRNRIPLEDIRKVLFNRALFSMLIMIVAVMVFQGVLQDSHAVFEISRSFTSAHVPLVMVVVILPFLVASITGITVAFVGTTFPIIFTLLADAGLAGQIRAYTVLAFCAGYVGVLLSPFHICLVLTCAYFKARLARIYKKLWLPCLGIAAAGVLSFWINRLI